MTLDSEDVDAIARRVAELLGQTRGLVDAQSVAAELKVERDWIYDPRYVRERLTALAAQPDMPPPDKRAPRRRARKPTPGVKLIQGRSSP
jgi:hypothetical protein